MFVCFQRQQGSRKDRYNYYTFAVHDIVVPLSDEELLIVHIFPFPVPYHGAIHHHVLALYQDTAK